MRIFSRIAGAGLAWGLVMGISASGVAAQEAVLSVGDRMPIFEGLTDEGELWRSREHVGRSILVVYFYPAAMTAGCTTQACLFRDNQSVLQEYGAEVIGVSGDGLDALKAFKGVNRLNFPLVSDPEGAIASAFGVPIRSGGSITRNIDGVDVTFTREVSMARWTYVIGRDGRITYKETDVDPAGDPEDVINHIRRLAADR
jgi:thioredoxin-dependent peroxiredoxin